MGNFYPLLMQDGGHFQSIGLRPFLGLNLKTSQAFVDGPYRVGEHDGNSHMAGERTWET
jgi:hypothetical protein